MDSYTASAESKQIKDVERKIAGGFNYEYGRAGNK